MTANILPQTKRYLERAVCILQNTPPSGFLPLLNRYLHRAVSRIRSSQTGAVLPPLKSYLAQTFPEREVLAVRNLRSISNGWENEVYSFTVEWGPVRQSWSEDIILRIYPGDSAQERSAVEVQALDWLYQVGYPVPRVERYEPAERSPFCKPFMLMEQIHGHSLRKDLFHSTPENFVRYLPVFCGLQARLHAVDWRSIVPNPAQYEPSSPYSVVHNSLEHCMPFIEKNAPAGLRPVWDWMVAHQRDVTSDGPVLVHLDFHGDNILLKDAPDPGGEAAVVIDWTAATLTDYRFDLAGTLLLIGVNDGWHFREVVLREYERQAGKAVEGLAFFEVTSFFSRFLSLILSLSYGAEAAGFRAGAEQVMRRQAPAMRNVYERHMQLTGITIPEVEGFLNEAKV